MRLAGIYILQLPAMRCVRGIVDVPAWIGFTGNVLKLTAENCGTVIPQWISNA